MKRIVEVTDAGFEAMLGESVCIICGIYIYSGKLAGVNDDHVELADAEIVYVTGAWSDAEWSNAQGLPGVWRVQKAAIESWGRGK